MTYDDAISLARQRYDQRDRTVQSPIYHIMRLGQEHMVLESPDSVTFATEKGWQVVGRCYDESRRIL